MQRLLTGLLRGYKRWVSPILPSACRFHPTCSVYAREAIERYGARRGSWLSVKRLARCHPFHPGGFDPVPPAPPASKFSAPMNQSPITYKQESHG